jgi:hypothetical protein
LEKRIQIVAEGLGADCDGEGNEHDQHGVFGSGSTTLVMPKASCQSEHLHFLLLGADFVTGRVEKRLQPPLSQ